MSKLYLVTGGTGHVGTVLINELLAKNVSIRALVRPGRREGIPAGVDVYEGDITNLDSMRDFFQTSGFDSVTLIHCAALITIASRLNTQVWNVNVHGTENVMQLALNAAVDRVVYVSSVHAIPEKPLGQIISEVSSFSPELVHGQYAKSKAAAAQVALDYAKKGLNLSIVHPSGIIGPGDTNIRNHMIRTIHAMAEGRIPVGLKGGYDFVDSRDVVSGILSCEKKGRCGECYILTGHYITVLQLLNVVRKIHGKKERKIEIPYGLVKAIAPISEGAARLIGRKAPLFTPYSVYTLHTNGDFSHEKATRELDYQPRDLVDSIRDSL